MTSETKPESNKSKDYLGTICQNRQEAAEWAEKQRHAGRTVAFTNGVFDLFHNGHLDSIRRAAAEADCLIVALNDDESVKRLKGEGRPILSIDQRMKVLSGIEEIDAVVPFGEDTPKEIIEAIKPDVLVKGGHYQIHEIVGHDFVLDRGGRVLSLPLVPNRSTTNIVEVVQQRFEIK